MKKTYIALAFYHLTFVEAPHFETQRHKKFFKNRDITSRIYLSHEGINGQMSGELSDIRAYQSFLREDPRFSKVVFKEDEVTGNIFPRITVKVRKHLVAFDRTIDMNVRGEHLSPLEWKEHLEKEEPYLLIDVRNEYETKIGHFDKAILPPAGTFKEFGKYADGLKEKMDPSKTKVLMYCTGGIRCEYYSSYMKSIGFDRVYQLEGGVINYGHQVGTEHWKGKLFVFDDRLAVPVGDKEQAPISECIYCNTPSDLHYNCANMDCNELFLSCPSCIEERKGCCSPECMTAERVRPFEASRGNKPFCRKHLIQVES
jgi:UPF0176 protein